MFDVPATNTMTERLVVESRSALGAHPLLYHDISTARQIPAQAAIVIAADRDGFAPQLDPALFDAMITTKPGAAAPWVSVVPTRFDAQCAAVSAAVSKAPIAASVLARVLRIAADLSFEDAIEVESLAYSTLLGGREFGHWLARRTPQLDPGSAPRVDYAREGDVVTLTIDDPARGNAMTAAMRDALYEALVNVLEDPSEPRLVLRGSGRCFSTGGYLPEFGAARDLAQAHAIRSLRSCARLLHLLGSRAEVRLHGACIGSGIEIPSASARRIGSPDTFVQLPELRMGLIPGAGGTVSIARAIGRHRLCWLALGGFRLNAVQARDWSLLHAIERR